MNLNETNHIEPKFPIEINWNKKIIKIGDYIIDKPIKYTLNPWNLLSKQKDFKLRKQYPHLYELQDEIDKLKLETSKLANIDNNNVLKQKIGELAHLQNRVLYDCFGRKSVFHKRIRGIVNKMWFADCYDDIKRYCNNGMGGRVFDTELIVRYHKYQKIINQCKLDNLDHLIPVVIYFGKNVDIIAKGIGKGLWKKIANTSRSRNHIIFQKLRHCLSEAMADDYIKKGLRQFTQSRINTLRFLYKLSTSILKSQSRIFHSTFHINNNTKSSVKEINQFRCIEIYFKHILPANVDYRWLSKQKCNKLASGPKLHIIQDTWRMAKAQNITFNFKWSFKRIYRLHEELSANYSKQNTDIELPKTIRANSFLKRLSSNASESMNINGVKFTLISKYEALISEGHQMHHCVASYWERIVKREIAIFSVISNGERSTLSITMRNKERRIQQHYSYCNSPPPLVHTAAAKKLVESL